MQGYGINELFFVFLLSSFHQLAEGRVLCIKYPKAIINVYIIHGNTYPSLYNKYAIIYREPGANRIKQQTGTRSQVSLVMTLPIVLFLRPIHTFLFVLFTKAQCTLFSIFDKCKSSRGHMVPDLLRPFRSNFFLFLSFWGALSSKNPALLSYARKKRLYNCSARLHIFRRTQRLFADLFARLWPEYLSMFACLFLLFQCFFYLAFVLFV